MESDVENHGEVHAVVEEHDEEVEVRKGTSIFNYEDGVVVIDGADTLHTVGMDRFVSWYLPQEFHHSP